jgi:hypothetical protein
MAIRFIQGEAMKHRFDMVPRQNYEDEDTHLRTVMWIDGEEMHVEFHFHFHNSSDAQDSGSSKENQRRSRREYSSTTCQTTTTRRQIRAKRDGESIGLLRGSSGSVNLRGGSGGLWPLLTCGGLRGNVELTVARGFLGLGSPVEPTSRSDEPFTPSTSFIEELKRTLRPSEFK